jgi:REP element-mobilizing transposase RayT
MKKDLPNRQSIRLNGYDYAQPGAYFITICVQNHICLLGDIVDGEMIRNDAGIMVENWWLECACKYPHIKCLEHVVMPNHFHCIIVILKY